MTIGILIPTYNRRDYLEHSLASVLHQTYRDLEVVVVDNGSIDGTAAFMEGITDPRVRYVVNEHNLGVIGSINKGVGLFSPQARWCMILSDDDLLNPTCLELLVGAVSDARARSVVRSHLEFIDATGRRIREARSSPREETALSFLEARSRGRRETYLAGVLFNKQVFNQIGGYPRFLTGLGSDDAFLFALALQDRLVCEPGALAYIRIHEAAESRSGADGIRKLQTIREFFDYCHAAVKMYVHLSPEQYRSLERSIRRYRINLNTYWWRTAVHATLDRVDGSARMVLEELRLCVLADRTSFSCRARIAVVVWNSLQINPESSRIWRAVGRAIDYVQFVIRNRLP